MKNVNVVISANSSWYIYNFRRNTILTLISLGCKVTVIAPKDNYTDKLLLLGASFVDLPIKPSSSNPIHDLVTLIFLCRFYWSNSVQVVLNFTPKNNIYSTFAARINKIPVIVNNIAGLGGLFINNTITTRIARFLYKCSQRFASKIFFQNVDDLALFQKYKMLSNVPYDILPGSGVDISRFTICESTNDGIVRFLLVARMLFDKGIIHYIEAARALKKKYGDKVQFDLLGFLDVDNPSAVSRNQMMEWVEEGIVNYLGVSDSVEEIMAKADCIVLPSFYREGVPRSLLEGAALGKLIVTTDNVGCRETVEHGINGYLCEPKSTSSLIEMLDKVINSSRQDRLAMGLASRAKVEKQFDEKIVIDKYISSINDLLN